MDILRLGDSALTCVFSEEERERGCQGVLKRGLERYSGEGIVDVVVSLRGVSVYVDVWRLRLSRVEGWCEEMERDWGKGECVGEEGGRVFREWLFPVCYDEEYSPDGEWCAKRAGVGYEEVVRCHSEREYEVLMIGFLPGFPFMGYVDERLKFGRRETPRVSVSAGSVGVAGGMTCIYPWESPGGWHILGMCPVPLFCSDRGEEACLLGVGDRVRFREVSGCEYEELREEMGRDNFETSRLLRVDEGRCVK